MYDDYYDVSMMEEEMVETLENSQEFHSDYGNLMEENMVSFLENSQALHTPLNALALWTAVYISHHGVSNVENSNYTYLNKYQDFDNYDNPRYFNGYWTPTIGGFRVPEGYGALSLNILVMKNIAPIYDRPYTNRRGWEYGHSVVRTLELLDNGTFVATTNENHGVKVQSDVYHLATHHNAIDTLSLTLAGNKESLT